MINACDIAAMRAKSNALAAIGGTESKQLRGKISRALPNCIRNVALGHAAKSWETLPSP